MVPIDPRFQLVRMESVRMMVAKATAQDKGFAARWSSRLTYLLVMLSPHPDGDRNDGNRSFRTAARTP